MAATRTLLLKFGLIPRQRHGLAARYHRRHFQRAGDLVGDPLRMGKLPVRATSGILDRTEES
jgi:hypothetical protein